MNPARFALLALFVLMPLGTTPSEIGAGLAVIVALGIVIWRRGKVDPGPLAGPMLAGWAGVLLLGFGPGADLLHTVLRGWPIAAALAVPILMDEAEFDPLPVGVYAALAPLGFVLAGRLGLLVAANPPSGPFSHHLTLAYALIPPLCAALGTRRAAVAAGIALTIALSGSSGGMLAIAAAVGVVAVRALTAQPHQANVAPLAGLSIVVGGVAAMALPAYAEDLRQRAILWSGGLILADRGGVPTGMLREAVEPVHAAIDPTFHFPQHAHDTIVQLAVDAGPAGPLALAWAAYQCRSGPPWLIGMGFALLAAACTQDWIGDLEVLRTAAVWAALALHLGTAPRDEVSQ